MRGAGFAYSFLGMRKLVYILFVSMLLLSGCFGKGGIDNQLNAVDGLLGNYPDSAMSVLVGMDTASMSDFQKDRRVLLYAYLSMSMAILLIWMKRTCGAEIQCSMAHSLAMR